MLIGAPWAGGLDPDSKLHYKLILYIASIITIKYLLPAFEINAGRTT